MATEDITKRLIPYKDAEDLADKVKSLFNPKDPSRYHLYTLLKYPSIFDWKSDFYGRNEEIDDLLKLPEEHPIVLEIKKQKKVALREIVTKSRDELRIKVPRYINAFERHIPGDGDHELFELVEKAAYHVIDANVVNDDNPPREASIVFAATCEMLRYADIYPESVDRFIDHAYDKKATLTFVVGGYCDHTDKRIETSFARYLEIFEIAQKEFSPDINEVQYFILNGIYRGFDFKGIGQRLQRKSPEYDCRQAYQHLDTSLKEKLDQIFPSKP